MKSLFISLLLFCAPLALYSDSETDDSVDVITFEHVDGEWVKDVVYEDVLLLEIGEGTVTFVTNGERYVISTAFVVTK